MTCALVVVGIPCLLVLGGLLSTGHLLWLLVHITNRPVRYPVPAWQRVCTLRHSGSCPCGVGVGCCVAVHMNRIVMGCGA
jgi:hypothetical protein